MARPRIEDAFEVVDLDSDSEEDEVSEDELGFFNARAAEHDYLGNEYPDMNMDGILEELNARYHPVHEAADGIIDLTGIPDIDVPPSDLVGPASEAAESDDFDRDDQLITEAVALQMVLDFLPDISVDHVLQILKRKTTDLTRTSVKCQNIISQLVEDGDYPKEDDEAHSKKRKRSNEDDWKDYDRAEPDPMMQTRKSLLFFYHGAEQLLESFRFE
jgi:TRIAD3 protein (E3 ubiquitin-protein ligase RNF216)